MATNSERLVLLDAFAGPGVYERGEPGSPIIMLNAFLEHTARARIAHAELVYGFIESDRARYKRLTKEVAKLGELPANVKLMVEHGRFEQLFGEILNDIDQRGGVLAPTFAFIDPFGYSGASMSFTGRFLQFDRCEVLIYVPLPFVNRFVGREGQENALTLLFGCDEWRRAVELTGPERQQFLHDLFRDQLVEQCSLPYVRSFEIVTRHGSTGYHLFFGTKHLRGLEKMKDAMWGVDPVEGRRFQDSTLSGELVLFQPEPDVTALTASLKRHFAGGVFSIEDALAHTLVATPFCSSHVKRRTLKPLEQQGELEAVSPSPGRRANTYPAGTRLRFL